MPKKRRIPQIRRYLILLPTGNVPHIRGPYRTDKARLTARAEEFADVDLVLILDVPFHPLIHRQDRRPFVDNI